MAPKPKHIGPNIFPSFPVFMRLLGYAAERQDIAIDDVTNDFRASHIQLLTDVLHVRSILYESLSDSIKEQLWRGEEVFFNLLTPAGYEFAVGFLAIIAIGGVIVPLSPALPVQEGEYYVRTSRAVALLTATKCLPLATPLTDAVRRSINPSFKCLELGPLTRQPPLSPGQIKISSDWLLDYHSAGLVIFTSGTTGPPKGALRRRSFLDAHGQRMADLYRIGAGDVVMHHLPVHHVTGIGTTFMPFLISGACVEFHSGSFDPVKVWERLRRKGLTLFSGVPTMYMRLMAHYESVLKKNGDGGTEYVDGARSLRAFMCGTAALPRPLANKWQELLGGRRILTRYGATEFSSGFTVHPSDRSCPDGSVGKIMAGLDIKLSEGEEGEILIKSPFMFSKYIFNEEATRKAFDEEGYYRTGDIGRREGDYFFIMGRANVDILKSGGYKISALDVEREILGLEYISEVMVVGVEDEEFGQRVAAAIVLKPDFQDKGLSLEKLREDMRSTIAGYKMPTLLRIVKELPKTASGKVIKKALTPQLFPADGHPDVQVWRKEGRARL